MEEKTENIENGREESVAVSFNRLHFMDTRDVQDLHGCHYKTAQILLKKLRCSLKKKPRTLISLEEFACYTGISLKMLQEFKKSKNKE